MMEDPIKIDDLGPTIIFGNTHILMHYHGRIGNKNHQLNKLRILGISLKLRYINPGSPTSICLRVDFRVSPFLKYKGLPSSKRNLHFVNGGFSMVATTWRAI